MKRSIFVIVLVMLALVGTALAQAPAGGQARGGRPNIFAPPATPSGPIADMVNSILTAFNNRDTAYLTKIIAPDAVWLDEDGHHLLAMVWMNRLMSANPQKKLSITNLRVGNWDTSGWAVINHGVDEDLHMSRGGRAWRGYFPVGGELTSGKPDLKEGIYFGAELKNVL